MIRFRIHDARRRLAPLLAVLLLAGCSRSDERQRVVLYYSADDHIAAPIIDRFEELTGIDVQERGDTEATKTTGLVTALQAERDAPRADVFWSSEVFLTTRLGDGGVLDAHHSDVTATWPKAYTDPDARWYGFGNRARVVVYNTNKVAEDDVPRTMHDLLDPRFKDRIVMARPEFGTTRGHMAFLLNQWGKDAYTAWLEALAANGVKLVDGNSTVVRAVARGEAYVGLTDTDDVVSGQRNDWPVKGFALRHDVEDDRIGPLVIPNTVARIRGGPNPDAAAQLIDFLLSEEVERMLAESDSRNIPVRPTLRDAYPELAVDDPAVVSYADTAAAMTEALEIFDSVDMP